MLTIEENRINFLYLKLVLLPNFLPLELAQGRTKEGRPMVRLRPSPSKPRWTFWIASFLLTDVYLVYLASRLGWLLWKGDEPVELHQWVIHGFLVGSGCFTHFFGSMIAYHAVTNAVIFNSFYDSEYFRDTENEPKLDSNPDPKSGESSELKPVADIGIPSDSIHPAGIPDFTGVPVEQKPTTTASAGKSAAKGKKPRSLLQMSGMELFSYYVLAACFIFGIVVPLVTTAAPPDTAFYFTSLPPRFRTVPVVVPIFAVLETWVCVKGVFVVGFFLYLHGFFLQKIDMMLAQLTHLWNDRAETATREDLFCGIQRLRRVQHLLNLFNAAHAYTVYALKNWTMWCAVGTGFYGILLFTKNPVLAGGNLYMTLDMIYCFITIYKRAFDVPSDMEDLGIRAVVLAHQRLGVRVRTATSIATEVLEDTGPGSSNSNGNSRRLRSTILVDERKLVRQEIRSIRIVGVQVGAFGSLGKDTTTNFLGFIFENLADLLIAYS